MDRGRRANNNNKLCLIQLTVISTSRLFCLLGWHRSCFLYNANAREEIRGSRKGKIRNNKTIMNRNLYCPTYKLAQVNAALAFFPSSFHRSVNNFSFNYERNILIILSPIICLARLPVVVVVVVRRPAWRRPVTSVC